MSNIDLKKPDWSPDLFIVVIAAFIVGFITYNKVEMIEFDFFVFENLSIHKAAGDWGGFAKYFSAFIYSIITGFIYYLCIKVWSLPVLFSMPLAFILGVFVIMLCIPLFAFILAVLAMLIGLLALFFGPVGR